MSSAPEQWGRCPLTLTINVVHIFNGVRTASSRQGFWIVTISIVHSDFTSAAVFPKTVYRI